MQDADLHAELHCHPATPCAVLRRIAVAAARHAGDLALEFVLEGDVDCLALPPPAPSRAVDGLWAHTCCEAFIAAAGEAGYREFNFAPSGEWAGYGFAGYRARADWAPPRPPVIDCRHEGATLHLAARLPAALLPAPPWTLGIAVVAEAADGGLSYWALAHPRPRPDFHDRAAWRLQVAA